MGGGSLGRASQLAAVVMTLVVAGCGQQAADPGDAGAKQRARALLIAADQLPRKYRVANGQDYPGELKVCGVRLEPQDVRGFAMKRYTRSAVGPFLYEFAFVGAGASNRELVNQVQRKLETCATDVVSTDGGKVTYDVTALRKLPRFGAASVGLKLQPRSEGLTSEYLLIRRGEVLVLLLTVAPAEISLPRELLVSGARAVTRQLEGGTG